MTQLTPAQFRENFCEFSDAVKFDSQSIQFWLDVGYQLLNADRWGRQLDLGAQLYAAHNLVLEARLQLEAKTGGIPGANGSGLGVATSKSVDKVSVSYDVSAAQQEFAGDYNLTVFGVRLWKLIRLFGAGPVQVATPGRSPLGGTSSVGAWSGPDCTPGFTNFS